MRNATSVLALLGVLTAAPAFAADSGFYVGLNGGYGWSSVHDTQTPWGATSISDQSAHTINPSLDGAVFGAQAGYNWQMDGWMAGFEGDFDAASASGNSAAVFPSKLVSTSTDGFAVNEKTKWLASIRARLGFDVGNGFAYLTGGGAWESKTDSGMTTAEVDSAVFGETSAYSFSHTRSGFVFGAGYEWWIAPSWTLRGEYLFYDFGSGNTDTVTYPNCANGPCGVNETSGKNNVSVFRVGVNYMLGE